MDCLHSWVAGMMHVHTEDLIAVAKLRTVECEKCELTVGPATPGAQVADLVWPGE